MASQEQINALSQEFLDKYYVDLRDSVSTNPGTQATAIVGLRARYDDSSTFSWEKETFTGGEDILGKIGSLRQEGNFERSSFSAQLRDTILIILATGILTPNNSTLGMNYTECFVINVSRNDSGFQFNVLNQVGKLAL
ncbi:hypothetical protein PT974_03461 [Cladobotryum mycophilum]|uniref:NTF2 domain-containing protein n=1 Tax=Cladobotryum mycophilum TaxID=491253 RepID=A0ABR0SSD9_9HYPO